MLKDVLKNIVKEKRREGAPDFVIKIFLKEYLQYPVLEYIYNNPKYKNFIFMGGSCLRICFDAPRMSEDLDFDLCPRDYKKFRIERLAGELKEYFSRKYLLPAEARLQGGKRIYLKFFILRELGLSGEKSESYFLYVKVEPSKAVFINPKIEIQPVSRFGFNFMVRRYSPEFLMTGKLGAIFTRQWFRGSDNEIDVKGRDFYDLYWYLEKGIKPDYKNLKKYIAINNQAELNQELGKRIAKSVTAQKLSYDLKSFFPNQDFVNDFCRNYKKVMERYLK